MGYQELYWKDVTSGTWSPRSPGKQPSGVRGHEHPETKTHSPAPRVMVRCGSHSPELHPHDLITPWRPHFQIPSPWG